MARYTRIVEVPASTKEVVDFVICDICGKRKEKWEQAEYQKKAGVEMPLRAYDMDELEISHWYGKGFPEGDHGYVLVNPDICPVCWETKVIPALRALGLSIRYEEYDR